MSARVNTNEGTFSLPNVPLQPGTNALVVQVTDVSGNWTQQVRQVVNQQSLTEGFGYDENGNVTYWVEGDTLWEYEWDWAGRLTGVTRWDAVVSANWYDAYGRRIAKQEVTGGQTNKWLYLYDGWNIVGVMNENEKEKGVSPGYCRIGINGVRPGAMLGGHGAQTQSPVSGRDLPSDEPGGSPGTDLPRRCGSAAFPGNARPGVR